MTEKGRALLDDLKERIQKNVEECGNLPIDVAMAKTRTLVLKTVTEFMEEHDLWEQHKHRNPGEFIVIAQDERDNTIVTVHIGDRLKKILGA